MFAIAARTARAVVAWPVSSQHVARRNALVATTALAQLRREREEVEEFLDQLAASRALGPTTLEIAVRMA